jgi:hypothetical protein
MSSIKPFQAWRNGRGAFDALKLHNLGESKWEKVCEAAEQVVTQRTWDGRNSRYPLKSHIAKHREAHNDFLRASQHIEYAVPIERTRVTRLLQSINCKDATVLSAKTTIMADNAKQNDFEQAADFLLKVSPVTLGKGRAHNISALNQGPSNHKRRKDQTETRYYTSEEWKALDKDERDAIIAKRKVKNQKKDHKKGGKKGLEQRIAALETVLEEKERRIASLTAQSTKPAAEAPLPPRTNGNPLQPPSGFTQRNN